MASVRVISSGITSYKLSQLVPQIEKLENDILLLRSLLEENKRKITELESLESLYKQAIELFEQRPYAMKFSTPEEKVILANSFKILGFDFPSDIDVATIILKSIKEEIPKRKALYRDQSEQLIKFEEALISKKEQEKALLANESEKERELKESIVKETVEQVSKNFRDLFQSASTSAHKEKKVAPDLKSAPIIAVNAEKSDLLDEKVKKFKLRLVDLLSPKYVSELSNAIDEIVNLANQLEKDVNVSKSQLQLSS